MKKIILVSFSFSLLFLLCLILWTPSLWFEVKLRLAVYGTNTYAVYLDSGHIFYGKLTGVTGATIVFRDVRSFQKYEVGGSTTNTLQSQLANPLTRPENFLVINRAHVLFFEKVGSDAPIVTQGVSPR